MHYQDRLCTLLMMFQLHSVTKIRMSIGTSPPIVSPPDFACWYDPSEKATRGCRIWRDRIFEVSKTVKRTVLLTCKSTHLL